MATGLWSTDNSIWLVQNQNGQTVDDIIGENHRETYNISRATNENNPTHRAALDDLMEFTNFQSNGSSSQASKKVVPEGNLN